MATAPRRFVMAQRRHVVHWGNGFVARLVTTIITLHQQRGMPDYLTATYVAYATGALPLPPLSQALQTLIAPLLLFAETLSTPERLGYFDS
jgi:hypothetical protein